MVQLKRFGVGQTAKVVAAIYLFLGLIFAVIALPVVIIGGGEMGGAGMGFGVGMIVLVPVLYAFIGWVGTAIGCVIYNFVAGKVGGIAVDLEG